MAILASGCGGFLAIGATTDIGEQYRANECAVVLERVDEYASMLADHPLALAEAQLYKGKCLSRMGRTDEAIAAYSYVSEQHPETPFAYEARALLAQLESRETP